jgi:IS30 family transposase
LLHGAKILSYLLEFSQPKIHRVHLTSEQRYEISVFLKAGIFFQKLAKKTVISCKIKRNEEGKLVKMALMKSKEAAIIHQKAIKLLTSWKPKLFAITDENGKEFANRLAITESLEIVY